MATHYGAAELRCHCADDEAGHSLGADGCAEKPLTVRASTDWPQLPTATRAGHGYAFPAAGTCSACGREGVKVTLREIHVADRPDLHDIVPGITIAGRPELAPHRRPGRGRGPCHGAGQVPSELRWRSRAFDAMVRDFGAESIC